MPFPPAWFAIPAALILLSVPAAAEEPKTAPAERADPQRPGLPPPYYSYGYGPETTEHRSLTVEEAIELSLRAASTYRQAQLDERSAAEDVAQAHAALFPQLTAQLGYVGTTRAGGLSSTEPVVPSFAPANGIHETSALLTVTGTIDLFGRLRAPLRRSRELLVAAHAGGEAARRDLTLATVDAYYGLALARQKRRIADETLALAESSADLTKRMAEGGEGEETEMFRARAEALRRRDELEQARAAESGATDVLRTLTGIPSSVHIGVARPTDLPPLEPFERYSAAVVLERPELAQLGALERAAKEDTASARAQRRPQLVYGVSGGFDATDLGELRRFSGASAQLALSVPITDFGGSRSREAQALLRLASLENLHESTERRLREEFLANRALAFSAFARVSESQERATASQRNLDLILKRYKERKATITELIDSQSAYADARSAYAQAITDYDTSRARLAADPRRLSYASATGVQRSAVARPAVCSVETAEAPAILGLRLGASLDTVRSRFPGLTVPPPNAQGVVRLELDGPAFGPPPTDDPAFGLAHASLDFEGGKLFLFRLVFSEGTTWETKDAFLAAASARFGLPGPWKAFYDWSDRTLKDGEDLRDLAVECRGFRVRVGLGLFSEGVRRVLLPHLKVEDVEVATALAAPAK
jgi:outer membrane protein TolC